MDRLVTIKSNRYGMELRMNPDVPFEEIQKAVVEKFTDAAGFFKCPDGDQLYGKDSDCH